MSALVRRVYKRHLSMCSLWYEIAYPSEDTVPLGSGQLANHSFNRAKVCSNHCSVGSGWLSYIPYMFAITSDCNTRRCIVWLKTALYAHGSPVNGPSLLRIGTISTSCNGEGSCLCQHLRRRARNKFDRLTATLTYPLGMVGGRPSAWHRSRSILYVIQKSRRRMSISSASTFSF